MLPKMVTGRRSLMSVSRLVESAPSQLTSRARWNWSSCFSPQARLKTGRRHYSEYSRNLPALSGLLKLSPEVADAVASNIPVVALESTIYTHGAMGSDLPLVIEDIVRKHGAVPATCGLLAGVPTVGLTPDEIERMVQEGAKKVSRRDLAYLVGMGLAGNKIHGGTTISGTMILARLAGIRVFGTGGLGGVHRGGHDSMDISADLTELGRTRVAVVSSGCKGFLDIPRTLEFLETQGVLVSTFADGRLGNIDFPAFWARESGSKSPSVVQTEHEAAAMILAQEQLGVETGLLFANPIPKEYAIPRETMESVINTAVREAEDKGFTGNENTPYILKRIRELTEGASVPANKALVQANVERAAKVAVELSKLLETPAYHKTTYTIQTPSTPSMPSLKVEISEDLTTRNQHTHTADILVAGSVAVDLSCDYTGGISKTGGKQVSPALHTSNPASISQSIGGVGHNVALAAHRVSEEGQVRLCSMVGDDIAGSTILAGLQASGMDTSCIRQLGQEYPSTRTAQYVAVNDAEKNLMVAMADMAIFSAHSFPTYWDSAVHAAEPKYLVVDGNWSAQDIRTFLQAGRRHGAKTVFEPVSAAKSERLFPPIQQQKSTSSPLLRLYPHATVDLATPNQYELAAMHAAARRNEYLESAGWFEIVDAFGIRGGARERFVSMTSAAMTDMGVPVQSVQLLPYIPTILTKMGANGALLTQLMGRDDPRLRDPEHARWVLTRCDNDHPTVGGVYMRLFPAVERVAGKDVVSVNGVGDTFLGVLVAGLARGGQVEDLVDVAQRAAVLTLRSRESVSPELVGLRRALWDAAAGAR